MGSDVSDLLQRSLRVVEARPGLAQRVIAGHTSRRRRRRIAGGAGAAVLAAVAVVTFWTQLDSTSQGRPAIITPQTPAPSSGQLIPEADRRPAPALVGTTVSGKAFVADFAKQPIMHQPEDFTIVNFCGSWSAPCRAVIPALRRPPYRSNAAPTLGFPRYVVVDERDSIGNAREFARSSGIDGTFVSDAAGAIGRTWHPDVGVPVTYVLDGDGLIAAQFDGAVTQAQLTAITDALAKENRGLYVHSLEFIAGIRGVTAEGRRLTITWDNLRCGNDSDLLGGIQVRENVRAVHLQVIAKTNPKIPNFALNCLPGRVPATTTVTLAAPLGTRLLLNALDDVPIKVAFK
jgi:hypothetical protein